MNNSGIILIGSFGALGIASNGKGVARVSVPRTDGMLRCFARSKAGVSIHPSKARPGVGFCIRMGNRVNYRGYFSTTGTTTRRGIRTMEGSLKVWSDVDVKQGSREVFVGGEENNKSMFLCPPFLLFPYRLCRGLRFFICFLLWLYLLFWVEWGV